MHHIVFALTALAGLAASAPTPARAPQQEGGLNGPDFTILTCQAQSIRVKTDWNTAFLTSDPAYTKYGYATQVVPLNGCADLSATFNAYFSDATPAGESMWSSIKCTIIGAPQGPDAELHILPRAPFHELSNADGVTVKCANHNDVPSGGYDEPGQDGGLGGEGANENEGEAGGEGGEPVVNEQEEVEGDATEGHGETEGEGDGHNQDDGAGEGQFQPETGDNQAEEPALERESGAEIETETEPEEAHEGDSQSQDESEGGEWAVPAEGQESGGEVA